MKLSTTYIGAFVVGILLLLIPLLREFHFESAFFIATLCSFWAGITAARTSRDVEFSRLSEIIIAAYLVSIPILIRAILVGCFSWHGAGFWLLLPAPSIVFGFSLGRLFRMLNVPFPTLFSVFGLLFVALGVFLMEFFNLPQVYYFNHVWGSWPGPIYDQAVLLTWSLVFFRISTLAWAAFLWILPEWKKTKKHTAAIGFLFLGLVIQFNNHPTLGISSPRSFLQQNLYQYNETEHFRFFFDPQQYSREEVEYWSLRHEFHFQQIVHILEIDWPEERKIESYLYANAWQKKKLVGAKNTSYVPVWLEQDQLHIAKEHLEGVLKHELVHVVSKQFGNDLFNASWSIGLVEGLAEAIAADASPVSTLDQILAAETPFPTAEEMENALTFKGFYASASSISYTTAGSFVDYLLEEYPIENFKNAYQNSSFDNWYEVPFDSLVSGWQSELPEIELDSLDEQVASRIFAQRSVFQISCPRKVTPLMFALDNILLYESLEDSVNAFIVLDELFQDNRSIDPIKQRWISYQLHFGNFDEVLEVISPSDTSFSFNMLKADTYLLNGDYQTAHKILTETHTELEPITEESIQYSFQVRTDSSTWAVFANSRYRWKLPEIEVAASTQFPLKWLLVNRAITLNDDEFLVRLMKSISEEETIEFWFNTQEDAINRLIYLQEFELAHQWIDRISAMNLRDRYKERIQEEQEWLDFIQSP